MNWESLKGQGLLWLYNDTSVLPKSEWTIPNQISVVEISDWKIIEYPSMFDKTKQSFVLVYAPTQQTFSYHWEQLAIAEAYLKETEVEWREIDD